MDSSKPSTSSNNNLAPGSPPKTPLASSNATSAVSNAMMPMGPILPFLNVASNLDADTLAIANAAAAAAYQDAIAARTRMAPVAKETPPRLRTFLSATPPTPTSPTRSALMSPFGDYGDQSFPSASPTSSRKMNFPRNYGNRNRANSGESKGDDMAHSPNETNGSIGGSSDDVPLTPGGSKPDKKMNLYKTELCRSWEETGTCRYGNKCQFAHSGEEVRNIDRHPKYKTEMCKTFWEKGTCPYGKRCCFIHTEKKENPRSAGPAPIQITRPRATSSNERHGLASAPPGDIKSLFDPVQDGFSLWSPSLASPDRHSAFPFDQRTINESMRQNLSHNLSHVEQALNSFHLNSPLDNPLALLSPITTTNNGTNLRQEVFPNSALTVDTVPILATPPRGPFVKNRSDNFSFIGNGPKSAPIQPSQQSPTFSQSPTFAQIAQSKHNDKGVLKKFDSGVEF